MPSYAVIVHALHSIMYCLLKNVFCMYLWTLFVTSTLCVYPPNHTVLQLIPELSPLTFQYNVICALGKLLCLFFLCLFLLANYTWNYSYLKGSTKWQTVNGRQRCEGRKDENNTNDKQQTITATAPCWSEHSWGRSCMLAADDEG